MRRDCAPRPGGRRTERDAGARSPENPRSRAARDPAPVVRPASRETAGRAAASARSSSCARHSMPRAASSRSTHSKSSETSVPPASSRTTSIWSNGIRSKSLDISTFHILRPRTPRGASSGPRRRRDVVDHVRQPIEMPRAVDEAHAPGRWTLDLGHRGIPPPLGIDQRRLEQEVVERERVADQAMRHDGERAGRSRPPPPPLAARPVAARS